MCIRDRGSDEEAVTEGSGDEVQSGSKAKEIKAELPDLFGTGNKDEDLRILLQQSPPREDHSHPPASHSQQHSRPPYRGGQQGGGRIPKLPPHSGAGDRGRGGFRPQMRGGGHNYRYGPPRYEHPHRYDHPQRYEHPGRYDHPHRYDHQQRFDHPGRYERLPRPNHGHGPHGMEPPMSMNVPQPTNLPGSHAFEVLPPLSSSVGPPPFSAPGPSTLAPPMPPVVSMSQHSMPSGPPIPAPQQQPRSFPPPPRYGSGPGPSHGGAPLGPGGILGTPNIGGMSNVQNMDAGMPPDPIPANNRIFVDGKAYEVKYIEDTPVIERNGQPHKIYFTGPPRDVVIDGVAHSLAFGDKKTVMIDGQPHIIRFGAPGRELYMGSYPFRGAFGGPLIYATINGNRHELRLCGPPPEVKIEPEPCYELLPYIQRYPQVRAGPVHDFGYSERPAVPQQSLPAPPPRIPAPAPQLDLSSILENLKNAGVIGAPQEPSKDLVGGKGTKRQKVPQHPPKPPTPPIPSGHHFKDDEAIEKQSNPPPTLKDSLTMRVLKVRYQSVIDSLYPTNKLCPNCGLRFDDSAGESRYRRHLDWHFRQNAKAKDTTKGLSRPWYYAAEDWINYTEQGDDTASLAKSAVFEGSSSQAQEASDSNQGTLDMVAPALSTQNVCTVCGEAFENFYDDDEEAWKCRNAMMVDGKMFHPVCYQDASLASVSTSDPAFLVQAEASSYTVPPGLDVGMGEEEKGIKTEPEEEQSTTKREIHENSPFGGTRQISGDCLIDKNVTRVASESGTGLGMPRSGSFGGFDTSRDEVVNNGVVASAVPASKENHAATTCTTKGYWGAVVRVKSEVQAPSTSGGAVADPRRKGLGDPGSLRGLPAAVRGKTVAEPRDGTPVQDEEELGVTPAPVGIGITREKSPGTPVRDEAE